MIQIINREHLRACEGPSLLLNNKEDKWNLIYFQIFRNSQKLKKAWSAIVHRAEYGNLSNRFRIILTSGEDRFLRAEYVIEGSSLRDSEKLQCVFDRHLERRRVISSRAGLNRRGRSCWRPPRVQQRASPRFLHYRLSDGSCVEDSKRRRSREGRTGGEAVGPDGEGRSHLWERNVRLEWQRGERSNFNGK